MLLAAGVLDSLQQIGQEALRREPDEPGQLCVSLVARGKTALAAVELLAQHTGMARCAATDVPDSDLVFVLGDALGPRYGTVVCDVVIPRSIGRVLDDCRRALRGAAEAQVPVMLLRRTALGEASTLLSVMIAPEDIDPAHEVAFATSRVIDVLGGLG
jgi:hypothetical protein